MIVSWGCVILSPARGVSCKCLKYGYNLSMINDEVGKKIKRLRLERGYSRERLARKIGVQQQTIEKYEIGEININLERLSQIAKALKVSVSYFLDCV